jgi:hypothetical protein
LFPGDPPLRIETRARWPIPNEFRREQNHVALKGAIELWDELLPNARFRSISAIYNCVGMVVAHRRSWAFPSDLHKVFRDDGFRRLGGPHESEIGDVVVYADDKGDVCHVGIVVSKNLVTDPQNPGDPLKVLSKWGAMGEYVHDMSYVPELLGKAIEFWTDRKGPG